VKPVFIIALLVVWEARNWGATAAHGRKCLDLPSIPRPSR